MEMGLQIAKWHLVINTIKLALLPSDVYDNFSIVGNGPWTVIKAFDIPENILITTSRYYF